MRQKPALLLVSLTFLVLKSQSFELQDTIHALIEENIHLHDQLENLTQALRELKRMLWQHGNNPDRKHDEAVQHLWDEWSQLGVCVHAYPTNKLTQDQICFDMTPFPPPRQASVQKLTCCWSTSFVDMMSPTQLPRSMMEHPFCCWGSPALPCCCS
ncbi:uncharacterized protein [Nothobranchius furzeri]|uniref:uncharacterized protein isoform X1 n=1 Tax=Nothobranchius furzeri TaxID=105023 RepID=UPI0039047E78